MTVTDRFDFLIGLLICLAGLISCYLIYPSAEAWLSLIFVGMGIFIMRVTFEGRHS